MKKTLLALSAASFLSLSAADIIIDRYGQFDKLNFPEKVTSDEQLKADIEADKAYYATFTPPKRTFWGGLPGSKEKYGLKATGFFPFREPLLFDLRCFVCAGQSFLFSHL